jgi:hypothetical protein
MKKIIFASFAVLITAHSVACAEVKQNDVIIRLCPGDKVYKRPLLGVMINSYKEGKIISADEAGNVKYKLAGSGEVIADKFSDIFPVVKNSRRGGFRVGEKVFSKGREATIIAINNWNEHEEVLIKFKDTGKVAHSSVILLSKTEGCQENICVGDVVNRKNYYRKDAIVVGLSEGFFGPAAVIKSIYSGKYKTESIAELEVKEKN